MAYYAKLQEFHMGDKKAVLKWMKARRKCSCQLRLENDKS